MRQTLGRIGTVGLCVIGLCVALSARAQEKPADFRTLVPLSLSGEGPWYRLNLPLNIQLAASQADLADLRVFNAAGDAQAYSLVQEPQLAQKRILTIVKAFPLYTSTEAHAAVPDDVRGESDASGTLVEVHQGSQPRARRRERHGWLLDTSAITSPLQQLILNWDGEEDGFQRFTIEASDDLQYWQSWGEGQLARLSFAGEHIEQREVKLPGRSARYLRLLWTSPQSVPMLTQVQLESTNTDSLPLPLVWSSPLVGTRNQTGEYQWQMATGLGIEQVKIPLNEPNSLAPVRLYGRQESNQPWRLVSQGLLYRLTQHGENVTQDHLPLDGQPLKQLKLVVDERGGDLGSQAPALQFAVRTTQLVFLARGAGPYTLALGNTNVAAAALPLTTLIPGNKTPVSELMGHATLQRPEVNSNFADKAALAPVTETHSGKKTVGLYAILLLGVLALTLMAFSVLRQKKSQ